MKKVLLIYGTRYGATREITEKIAETLKSSGLEVRLVNSAEEKVPPLKGYEGVLIGTGIKMGMWTKKIKKVVKQNADALNHRDFKLGLYVCCGLAAEKDKIPEAIDTYIVKKLEKLGLTPDLYDAFGGTYDLREDSNIGKVMRKILEGILKKERGLEVVESKVYDFRDWDQIQSFAGKFAAHLE